MDCLLEICRSDVIALTADPIRLSLVISNFVPGWKKQHMIMSAFEFTLLCKQHPLAKQFILVSFGAKPILEFVPFCTSTLICYEHFPHILKGYPFQSLCDAGGIS